jgi:hypothetical protein
MQIKGVLQQGFERLVARLPAPYREGKMPYIVFFVGVVITILLVYSAISPYQNATPLFLSMAAWSAGGSSAVFWLVEVRSWRPELPS